MFVSDGCSVPDWKWIRKIYPHIDYWADVFGLNACYMHDLAHATRRGSRLESIRRFRRDAYSYAHKHVYKDLQLPKESEAGKILYKQGMKYASVMTTALFFGSWYDWYFAKPIKKLFRRWF